ncbi:hypothetical protein LUU34_01461700 [Aix galericulata]|nr:hypothetical protein LUU34_01461700 [Aix galericulata]
MFQALHLDQVRYLGQIHLQVLVAMFLVPGQMQQPQWVGLIHIQERVLTNLLQQKLKIFISQRKMLSPLTRPILHRYWAN